MINKLRARIQRCLFVSAAVARRVILRLICIQRRHYLLSSAGKEPKMETEASGAHRRFWVDSKYYPGGQKPAAAPTKYVRCKIYGRE